MTDVIHTSYFIDALISFIVPMETGNAKRPVHSWIWTWVLTFVSQKCHCGCFRGSFVSVYHRMWNTFHIVFGRERASDVRDSPAFLGPWLWLIYFSFPKLLSTMTLECRFLLRWEPEQHKVESLVKCLRLFIRVLIHVFHWLSSFQG